MKALSLVAVYVWLVGLTISLVWAGWRLLGTVESDNMPREEVARRYSGGPARTGWLVFALALFAAGSVAILALLYSENFTL